MTAPSPRKLPWPIRVVLVEDSVTQREALKACLESEKDIRVVGEARNGKEGIEKTLAMKPDVVVTDVWMPEATGLDLVRAVLAQTGIPIVVVSASFDKREVDTAFECLAAGAVATMEKPDGPTYQAIPGMGAELRATVREFAGVEIRVRRLFPSRRPPGLLVPDVSRARAPRIIGIAASTGGPFILSEILRALPADYPIPILLVQHISPGFEPGFADWLGRQVQAPVQIALRGERAVAPGIYIAPQGRHLMIENAGILELAPPELDDIHVPSADRLFLSLASAYGARAAGVILTGMGEDGVNGLARIHEAGGRVVAQDEESSVVWGMPGSAVRRGVVDDVLDPSGIAAWLLTFRQYAIESAS